MIQFTKNNKFFITGASSGIGRAISLKINELGGFVIAISRDNDKLNKVRADAAYQENFIVEPKDLTEDIEALPTFVRNLSKKYGKIQGMVHCAGKIDLLPARGLIISRLKKLFDINFFSGVALAKGFSDKRVYSENSSSIIFISSIVSMLGVKGQSGYASTKGAINSIIKPMAMEFSKNNIRVNAVSPGYIVTKMSNNAEKFYSKEYQSEIKNMYPLGEGQSDDIASLVVFLLSDQARWITGQNIIIDGGRTLW